MPPLEALPTPGEEVLRRGVHSLGLFECGASRHLPLGVCLFLSLFAVCRRFSLQPHFNEIKRLVYSYYEGEWDGDGLFGEHHGARGFDYPPDWGSDDGYGEDDGF